MTNDELRRLKEERNARKAAIDFLQDEWSARFDPARFSRSSIGKFFPLGLTVQKALEATEAVEWKTEQNRNLASEADGLWRYIRGTCWNMINGVVLVTDD